MDNRVEWGRLVVWSIDSHLDEVVAALEGVAGMDRGQWRDLLEELRDELAAATVHLEHVQELLEHELEICEETPSEESDRTRNSELSVRAMLSARAQAQALWTLAYRRVGGLFQHALTLANCPVAADLVRPTLLRTSGEAPLPSPHLVRQGVRPPRMFGTGRPRI
ncbi:MAG: hypothetical protein ACQEVA_03150 [Myxococcota bacterium]